MSRPTWHEQAACAPQPGVRADDWALNQKRGPAVPTQGNTRALRACHACPVRIECRDEMLARYRPGTYPLGVIMAGWWWPNSDRGTVKPHPDDAPILRGLVERTRAAS